MLTYLSGDPLLTRAQTLAFGFNAKGQAEVDPLHTALLDHYPAAFASFKKQARQGRIQTGQLWVWRESKPHLMFLVIRETAVGMTRPRYVESVALTLARDYKLHGLKTLAIAPLGTALEWPLHRQIFDQWLARIPLPVTIYESYHPGIDAETSE